MEDGVGVVPALRQHEEVLACARREIAVQLQIEVAQIRVQAHVALLLGAALHSHHRARVLRRHVHRRGRERPRSRACRSADSRISALKSKFKRIGIEFDVYASSCRVVNTLVI